MTVTFMRLESIGRALYLGGSIIALGLCLVASPARAQEPSPPPPTPPSESTKTALRGVVTAEAGGAPQPGASVTIPAIGAVAVTDERGEYTLAVPPGTYTVRVESPGAFPLEKTITVGEVPAVLDFRVAEDQLGEVITIIGSRTPRSRLETSVPVDVITNEVITESSHTEMNQILNTIAPSFNASRLSVVDGTDHIDPADLRGLGPEHVLVLINGKRLHQSSLINVYNGGTVGVDLNAIPTNAIARIEVLRDGAASQYGSDAIAGVINIVLKETVDVTDFYAMVGSTASNDGQQFKLGANTGAKLGDRGFVNVTGEFFARGRTNRAKPWPDDIFPGISGQEDTDAELKRRGLTRASFKMDVGQAGALVGTTFLNAGYKLDDVFELHAQGGYTYRHGNASGFYRFPTAEKQVDLSVYPNGFLPEINPVMNAWTATAGVRAKKGPMDGDLSLTYGGDTFHFFVDNSINASLGPASPTHFDAGRLKYDQTSLNLDGVWHLIQGAHQSVSVVGGAETRLETYGIKAGQPESYELGPVTTADGTPKIPGSQVFPGFRPTDASDNNRLSEAVYGGIETQPFARANIDAGARFEHYSDFGNTVTGKLAGRLAVIKSADNEVAVRGSVSNGFRAPGLQQIWYSTIATQFFADEKTGKTMPNNLLVSPNQSDVTAAFGVPRLKEETSINVSGGLTTRLFSNLSLSADYFRVAIKDRVVLSGLFSNDDKIIGEQVTEIVRPFDGVTKTQFFVNAVDTTTNGVDIVLDYSLRLPAGSLKLTAAANYTKTTVDDVRVPQSMKDKFPVDGGAQRVSDVFLGRYGRNRFEDLLPQKKGTVGVRWDMRGWSAGVRTNYFGRTKYHSDEKSMETAPGRDDGEFLDESFGARITVDVDVGYRIGGLWWSVGANNVFNNFPDELKRPENRNSDSFLYSPVGVPAGAPYGTDGAFYYVRAEYRY
jgi:iron complex outermembrane receptor protein